MRRGLLLITGAALLVPAGSAPAARYEVLNFAWSARLTYEEENASGEPRTIRDEQGETASSFRYRSRGSGERFSFTRRGGFRTGQRYTVARNATWREDTGSGFENRDCIDIDRRRGGGGVDFRLRRSGNVRVNYAIPVALDTCGPALYDDLELAEKLEIGTRQLVPRDRFDAARLRLGIRGRQVLPPDESGVRTVLTWRASVKIARR
jgi:hypothetical protein